MPDVLIYLVLIVFGIALGIYIGRLISKSKSESLNERVKILDQDKANLHAVVNEITKENKQLLQQNATYETELKNLKEKIESGKKEMEDVQKKLQEKFENLANKIFDEKSDKSQQNIKNILDPLQKKISEFEKKVQETQEKSVGMHSALKQQLTDLKDLNQKMSKEAINLTKALKGDTKAQGDWGEIQLELLLEKANLVKDIHFTTQGGFRDPEGRLKKPDFIVNLPDDRNLIIDSKVSLVHYEAYFSEENEKEKEGHLKKLIESLRKHFKDLGDKSYDSLYQINTPDYVLMFVPIEPALMLALSHVRDLYLEALDKKVVLVSSSTLLAILSTVSSMWRQENQKRNVLEIAEQAGRLYDQFVNLTDDLIKVGNQLKTVQGSYDSSMKKLTGKGNLVKKVERIKELGAKTSKNINANLLTRASED